MVKLTDKEKKELKETAESDMLRKDFKKMSCNRYAFFYENNGDVNLDKYITFLTEFNYFVNHQPKPFRKIIDDKNIL